MVKFKAKISPIGHSYHILISRALVEYGVIEAGKMYEWRLVGPAKVKKQPANPQNNEGVIYQYGVTFDRAALEAAA